MCVLIWHRHVKGIAEIDPWVSLVIQVHSSVNGDIKPGSISNTGERSSLGV